MLNEYNVDATLTCSGTRRSNVYSFRPDARRVVHLIDTPGFDDTGTKDSEILKEIALFLNGLYSENHLLTGVILLHRITDQRMGGSSLRNLRILQKLCGEPAYPHICLASTMWSKLVDEAAGVSREQGLVESANFWAPMKAKGSIISRHRDTVDSAMQIVDTLIGRGTTVLDIQRQMVDQMLDLNETTVGEYLEQELQEARRQHEKEIKELEEALLEATEDNDQQLVKILKEQQEARVKALSSARTEQRELRVSPKALDIEREKYFEEAEYALQKQIESLQDELARRSIGPSRDMDTVINYRENLIAHNQRFEHDALVQQQDSEHERRALVTQLAMKQQELQMQRRRPSPGWSGLGGFLKTLFAGLNSDHTGDPVANRSYFYHSGAGGERGQVYYVPRERGPPPPSFKYQSLTERTFRSGTMILGRKM